MGEYSKMEDFLDSFEHTGIYIIDRETMEVYYENKTAKKYTVKDRIGQPCYKVHGNIEMCASCPLRIKERKSYVNREDHGMVFSVSAKDTSWNGVPTYTIIVEKEKDLPKRSTLSEASLERMNRALHSSIISYVDVNMQDKTCQAIHFSQDGNHKIYDMKYDEYMRDICFNEYVFLEDQIRGEKILGIENLQRLSENSTGSNEVSVRFRIRSASGEVHVLESTAYVLRDELPHHISIVGKEVSREERSRVQLSLYNKVISQAVTTFQLNLTQNTFQEVVGFKLMTENAINNVKACADLDEFYKYVIKCTVGEEEKKKCELFLNRKRQLQLFSQNQSILRERLPIDMDDGTYQWLDITCNMLKNPMTGDIEAILYSEIVDEDVISENVINQMISNDYDYVALFDLTRHTNKVFTNSSRYTKEDMERNLNTENREAYLRRIYAGDDIETFIYYNSISYIRKQLKEKEKFDNVYHVREEDGVISCKKETISYLNGDTRYLLLSRTDNTEVVRSQSELNIELTKALQSAQRATEEKTELFARMSHDLRTPMNGILGMISLSKKETNLDILYENMERMDESGRYMLRMINDTLDMKRIETGQLVLKPGIKKCSTFIQNIEEMIRPGMEEKRQTFHVVNKNIDLNRYAMFDEVRMKQIFVNVISNAIKYTPEDGIIEFSMECLAHENGIDRDVFTIVDTGIGMSKEFQKNGLFLPFEQENNALTGRYAGPGLGLAITKSLVDLMGGRIEVESELGEGTTIRVYLDIQMIDQEKAMEILGKKEQAVENAKVALKDKKILLCEDHPLNAKISKKLLERVGCKVIWVKDGKEGVDVFSSSKPFSIDAILMDIQMPEMNGIEASETIRKLVRPDARAVPIIAMTANAFAQDKERTKAAGMNEHLAKPVIPAKLYETLVEYLQI